MFIEKISKGEKSRLVRMRARFVHVLKERKGISGTG